MCRADLYVVLTPDRDIYVEELGLLNAHVRNIRVRPHPGVAPPGVAAAEIYAMPAFAVDEMNEFLDEARTLADQERAMMAVGGPAAASLAGAGAWQGLELQLQLGFSLGLVSRSLLKLWMDTLRESSSGWPHIVLTLLQMEGGGSIFVLMEEITTGSCRSQHRRIIGCLHLS